MYTRFYTEDDALAARARFNILARISDEIRQLKLDMLLKELIEKRRRKVKKK